MYGQTITQQLASQVFGDPATGNSNLLFDATTGRINFRGSTTTQSYLDTDGSFVVSNGVTINATGIYIVPENGGTYTDLSGYRFSYDGSTVLGGLYGQRETTTPFAAMYLRILGESGYATTAEVHAEAASDSIGYARLVAKSTSHTQMQLHLKAINTGVSYAYLYESIGTFGGLTVGATGDPAAFLDVRGDLLIGSSSQFAINSSGLVTKQNNVATEGMGVATIVDSVALTGQVADITATNISSGNVAGRYRVSYYLEDTTADVLAGAVTVTFAFTDAAGSTTVASAPVALTALGRGSGSFFVQLSSGNITYAVTHTGIFSTSAFALYIIAERLA